MQGFVSRPGLAMALASLAALPAAAQTPPSTPPKQPGVAPAPTTAVEQIIVTANKRREAQRSVANSVTALSGKELDRRQEVTLQDLANEVPGLSLETDDKTAVRIVLRGLNTGSVGATVASLLDGVPANASGALNNAAVNTPNFDTYDLQRIEVLRGPQGTLYGATAEGGLVKYETNPPDPTGYHGGLETGIDGLTGGGVGGSLKGFINIPLADGKAAIRLTGWNEWEPGYVDDPQTGRSNDNSWQQYGWRASVLVNPTPDLTIRLTADRQSLFSNNVDYVDVVGAAANPAAPPANQLAFTDGLRNATYLQQPSQNESAVYDAHVDYDFGWSTLTSITAFTYAKFFSFSDATATNVAAGVPIGAYLGSIYGAPVAVDERQNSNTDKFSQEVRLASDPGQTLFGQDLTWLAGAYYTHETASLLQYLDSRSFSQLGTILNAPATGGLALYDSLSEWAFFGQADYHFLPSLDLELGGRWSGNAQHSSTIYSCCVLYGPSAAGSEIYSNDHDALYSVAPRWRPTDDTMLYGRIATGYRPGGPNLPVPGVTGIPTSYGPDRTTNYEIGVRQDFFHKSVAIDVTGYYIDWKDVQILSLVNTPAGPVGVNGNAGSAVSKGVEWDLAWVPLDGLRLSAVGDYTDSRLTVNAPGLGGSAGDFLPYVPNISSSVNADYSWIPADGYRAYVSGTWSYTGTRYTSFAPSGNVTESHTRLPGYNTGALRIGLEQGRYSGELYLNNIGDSRAITFYTNQGGLNETGQATIIQPRLIGFVARAGF